jgi:hypothetical protein
MRVNVYVEGPSDKEAMKTLLAGLIERKAQDGILIDFFDYPKGDRKESLLTQVPKKAVNNLQNSEHDFVVIMPDLYPQNKGFPHRTYQELSDGIFRNFDAALHEKGITDQRIRQRLKVYCFKHDLEALLLAAEESLQFQFGDKPLGANWKKPVEDQNHNQPPKRIIEAIYQKYGRRYKDTVDAPLILRGVSYQTLAERCPQCFKPFVEFLENLSASV